MANVIKESANQRNCSYTIEAPGVLRSNANYNVAVTLLDVPEPCDVQITISGGNFKLEKTITVQPFSSEILYFEEKIPDLDPAELYFLDVESLTGIEFNETIELLFEKGRPLVYIQLDKQAYKRGDKVDFRVLLLEHQLLRPFKTESPIAICLQQSNEIIFEKIVELDRGLYTDQWLIQDDASHGSYAMKVFLGEALVATKNFEIIDYTPPTFKIDIKAPKELIYVQKQIHVDVEANYFDGSPVEGTCKLEVESVSGFFSGIYIEKFMPISGKIETTIVDVVEDLDIDNAFIDSEWFSIAKIMLKATVTASGTSDQESLTKLVTLKRDATVREEDHEECSSCKRCNDCGTCCEVEEENYFAQEENENSIEIKVTSPRTNNVPIGNVLNFDIKLRKPTTHCLYFVIARGNIIKSELIKVEDCTLSIARSVETSFINVPRSFILAYFIHDGVLYFDEIGINLTRNFENQLSLRVPETASPTAVIPIEIETAPNSLIGIMAVDAESVAINANNDLRYDQFFKDLYYVRSQVPEMNASGRYPGLMSGMVTFTNAKMDGFEPDDSEDGRYSFFPDREHIDDDDWRPRIDIERKKKKVMRQMQEQSQVFGNWLFINKETDNNGKLQFDAIVPEKSSVWLLTVFALNMERGFAMTTVPAKVANKTACVSSNIVEEVEVRVAKTHCSKFIFDHYDSDVISRRDITLTIPPNVTIMEVTISITENLFGPVLAHLKDFAGKMYCTGYLHMTTVAPNVAVLEYLDKLNQLDSDLAKSIKARFPEAIKRDLDERRENNSFGWFRSDIDGSPHVTSLVVQTFQSVAKYVDVDSSIIEDGLTYMASLQLESGEILKENQPYKYLFEKGSCVGLTSFVLLAFVKNHDISQRYKTFIEKGFSYIVANVEPINCVYDLAIAFYAMQLYKLPYAVSLKERLFKIALRDLKNDHMWWSYSLVQSLDSNYYAAVSDREVTSYVALGLLETEPIETILPIIKWMFPLKDLRSESMDCGLALEVILKAAVKAGVTGSMNVAYAALNSSNQYSGTINLTPQNSRRVQTHVLPKSTKKIELSTKDKGSFYGNISYRYIEN